MTIEPEMTTVETPDLSAIFGELLEPPYFDDLERDVRPRSLQLLNDETAKWLKAFMEATEKGLGVTRYVYCELPILWVVDSAGQILLSVEEVVETEHPHEFVRPRLRNTPQMWRGLRGRAGEFAVARPSRAREVPCVLLEGAEFLKTLENGA
jgi:hypothetical protein